MNIRFNRKLFAILLSVIALLSIATAKDYSITAGNWQVDFSTNDTLQTDTIESERFASKASEPSDYLIIINKDPVVRGMVGVICLTETTERLPYDKDSLRSYVTRLNPSNNKTPILSDYLIDGTDAVIAEGWNDKGRRRYDH